jgi:hypothetical protein
MLPVGPPLAGLHHVEPDRQVEHRHADQRVRGVARHCRGLVGGASGNTCLSCAACLSHPAWLQYPIRHGYNIPFGMAPLRICARPKPAAGHSLPRLWAWPHSSSHCVRADGVHSGPRG